ncbi:MAG: carboxypeptidase M32 [Bacillota bacterium]|nr:carboxypeptidase M32 [Bacillota bacterium]
MGGILVKESFEVKLQEFKDYLRNIENLNSTIALLEWDSMVNLPSKGVPFRSEVLGYLSGESYKLTTSDKMKEFIDFFNGKDNLDDITRAMVEKSKKEYDMTQKIPADEYREYTIAASNSGAAWEEAKDKSDFSIFEPHLKKIVDYKKKFIEYWGYSGDKYDTLLDFYEPGITVKDLDIVFGELKTAIMEILNKINASEYKPKTDFFKGSFSKNLQEDFIKLILTKMEYDFNERGRIDESTHPFTTNFGNKDVRITTHYYENEFRSALFSCIHEGGHAIYEQDIPDELRGTTLAEGTSMGLHESQSRFYENMIGKSKEFWHYFYPEAQKRFPQLKDISFEEFYKGLNYVEPSLIRIEADELTYSIHIIIRYEIEKALINDEIDVGDLPKVWSAKYKEYLGVEPKNDSEGVLQDMHWSDGSFGYFPSYALGNLYGAQFLNKMLKDVPDLYAQIQKGNLSIVHQWLSDNIHRYGAVYKPSELIKRVTGEKLEAKYFIDYLNRKFKEVYNL